MATSRKAILRRQAERLAGIDIVTSEVDASKL